MKVKAQVSQIGHASLWSPKVKATNVKPEHVITLELETFGLP